MEPIPVAMPQKTGNEPISPTSLPEIKTFLDMVHIRECLVRPYREYPDYPLVDTKDLLPSFDAELYEYKGLPGFSFVLFDRQLSSFNEPFQYDILVPDKSANDDKSAASVDLMTHTVNMQILSSRLPKSLRKEFAEAFIRIPDITSPAVYERLLPYLLTMDRAQVFAKNADGQYYLAGIFASFPSDFDGELKRFGVKIGKFKSGDNALYERNRRFVNQYLMELYGFPIASERRTSSALFACRLHRAGERFIIRVLGQSDRVLTTIWSDGTPRRYPYVEKTALVSIPLERRDLTEYIDRAGAFVDREKRVVILKVSYKQHSYHAANIQQDRALSVARQDVIHPVTGAILSGLNIIKDHTTLILHLNDIVRGEYVGRMVYNRTELIERTDTVELRLKALSSWITKNQRRIIGYSADFYSGATHILDDYLHSAEMVDLPTDLKKIKNEIEQRYAYIRQARHIQAFAALAERDTEGGERINYLTMLQTANTLLRDMKFELANYFDELLEQLIVTVEALLNDAYVRRKYINCSESNLSAYGKDVRKAYQNMVSLLDELKDIQKVHIARTL